MNSTLRTTRRSFTLSMMGAVAAPAQTSEDLREHALAGYDKLDIASVDHPKEDYSAAMKQSVSGLRLGIPRAPFFDLVDPDVAKAVDEAIRVL